MKKRFIDLAWLIAIFVLIWLAVIFSKSPQGFIPDNYDECAKWRSEYYQARSLINKYGDIKASEVTGDELATYSLFKSQYNEAKAKLESLGCDYTP